jgi:hypothetical protein
LVGRFGSIYFIRIAPIGVNRLGYGHADAC